ncbi:MAG TPA: CBS domain-containing protein [Ruminococcaceae bacterium]|jgi:CBS domain-containing protein|nr:CBS domain-containing protein [Oscillospiraceae bacterium]HBG55100.1 CBS domain-containing protein [Oscillospiraceae bacterium]HBQ45950.1 CBS domain-containing protein [Oscillospiraceae bacterium]HBT90861.1 CBS domain-containing protein [Oscillospiraceae bacterium]
MRVKDIMTKDVASLNPEDSTERAAQLMKQYDIGSIPVCQQQKVVGIVTDRDIALRSVAAGQDPRRQKVREIMSPSPAVGDPEMDVHDAARVMSEKQVRRLPIVDRGSLVGVVALGDISVEPSLADNAGQALNQISQPAQM